MAQEQPLLNFAQAASPSHRPLDSFRLRATMSVAFSMECSNSDDDRINEDEMLVAAEPLVIDPVAMDWDDDGRLYVVEMRGYMPADPRAFLADLAARPPVAAFCERHGGLLDDCLRVIVRDSGAKGHRPMQSLLTASYQARNGTMKRINRTQDHAVFLGCR